MTINVLGIAGSPEIGGNTEILLDKVLEGCNCNKDVDVDIEKIIVSKLKIHPCTSCRSCAKTGKCIIDDQMQHVYQKLLWANCVIVATPLYFMSVPAQTKSLIDRCQMFWSKKFLLNRPIVNKEQIKHRKGILISTAGQKRKNMFDGLAKTIKSFFVTIDVTFDEDNFLLFCGIENKKDILKHPNHMKKAYNTGKDLVV